MSDISTRLILTVSLVVVAVGLLDAFIGGHVDLLVIFAITGCLQLLLWLRQKASRIPVTLRPDLAHRLDAHAQQTGEQIETVLDRSVAWYESGLYGSERAEL
jgi:hypothetical protein